MTRRLGLISCSLSADELSERWAAWQSVRERLQVVERDRFPGGFRLRFRGTHDDIGAAGELVAAERTCCEWAEWQLDPTPDGAILTVSGREDLIAPLARSFLGGGASYSGASSRTTQDGGAERSSRLSEGLTERASLPGCR
jgi:hypothetical protein